MIHAKIEPMKAELPKPPEHHSRKVHRRQVARQIYLPIALASLLMIAVSILVGVTTFRDGGDVGRWAAISTMWILIPVILAGLIFLAIIVALIYLLAQALRYLPRYTGIAQDYTYYARTRIIHGAKAAEKPFHALSRFFEQVDTFADEVLRKVKLR